MLKAANETLNNIHEFQLKKYNQLVACQAEQRQLPYNLPPAIYNLHSNKARLCVLPF
jgi:hypothetical protein